MQLPKENTYTSLPTPVAQLRIRYLCSLDNSKACSNIDSLVIIQLQICEGNPPSQLNSKPLESFENFPKMKMQDHTFMVSHSL